MLPYALGYVLYFALGHFVPLDEADRAEGCNALSSLLSDLCRFLSLVLVVSLSLKVDKEPWSYFHQKNSNKHIYD